MTRSITIGLLLLCCLTLSARAEDTNLRTVSTSGDATVYVAPDQAEISLGVYSYAEKLADAKSANDSAATGAIVAVKKLGIDAKDISTSEVSVQVNYGNYPQRSIAGYSVERSYVVKVTDMSLISKVIDAALSNGANQVNSVTLTSTQMRKYRDQARKMAAKAAKEKAVDLAGELDAVVGSVRTINESTGVWGNVWGGAQGRYYAGGMVAQNAMSEVGGNPGNSDEATPLGQIAIKASVTATFDLRDSGK